MRFRLVMVVFVLFAPLVGVVGAGAAALPTLAVDDVLVVDSFDRPDGPLGSAETGQPWVVSGGLDFAVASDQARVTSGRGEGVALVDAGSADVTASARLVLPSSPSTLGLSLRAVDAANQLLVSMHRSTGKVALYKVDGGAYGQLALSSATFAPGTTHDFAVTLDGAEITVRVDGAVVLTHTLSAGDQATYGSRTGMGLRLYRSASVDFQSRWDDFTVTTGEPEPDTESPIVPAGQSFTVSEEAGVGSVVGTVVATDNVEVTGFAITAGNTGGVFAIDDAGVLSVASGLDAAATPSYSLTVQASDAAGNTGSGTVGVTVTPAGAFVVVDSFDRPDGPLGSAETGQPWVVSGGLDFAVASDQARVTSGRGEGVALVDAGSADVTASARLVLPSSPSTLGLSLRAVDAANQLLVSMHRSTGKVALYKVDGGAYGQLALSSATFAPGTTHDFAVTLDGAEITVRVDGAVVLTHTLSAGDQATYGSRTGMGLRLYRSASVDFQSRWDDFTVTTGEPEPDTESPIVPAGQSFTVSEEAGVGSVVGTVVATDNVEVTGFAITAGNTGGVFAIDDAGVLSVASGLDAAATPSYSLTVQASDAAGNTGSGTIEVTVTPVEGAVVKTDYNAVVIHYNPDIVDRSGELRPLDDVRDMRAVGPLTEQYIEAIREVSGGQVNWNVIDTYEVAEFPAGSPLTAETYLDTLDAGCPGIPRPDYPAILKDPRFDILDRVASGELDSVWVFPFRCTAFFEAAMAGDGAFWVNGSPISGIDGPRFIVYGFGHESNQHHGFMLENTGHALENVLRRATNWPTTSTEPVWLDYDVRGTDWRTVDVDLTDWQQYLQTDALNYDSWSSGDDFLASPGGAGIGTVHWPPNSIANYGWEPFSETFSYAGDDWDTVEGAWSRTDREFQVDTTVDAKAVAYDRSVTNGRTRTMADFDLRVTVGTDAPGTAGLLFRLEHYGDATDDRGYFAGIDTDAERVVLSTVVDGVWTELASAPASVAPDSPVRLRVVADGSSLRVHLADDPVPIVDVVDTTFPRGAFGLASRAVAASFDDVWANVTVPTDAEAWYSYPDLTAAPTQVDSLTWDSDHAEWLEWIFEHLPKGTGTNHDGILNTWWPYLVDPAHFDPLERYPDVQFPMPDTSAPEAPTPVTLVANHPYAVQIGWTEPADDVGVTRYDVYRDGTFLHQTPNLRWTDETAVPGQTYEYEIVARDGTGNRSDLASITVTTSSADDLLRNGDMEDGSLGVVGVWATTSFRPDAVFAWEAGTGRDGSHGVRISNDPVDNDSRYVQEVSGLVPGGRYRLSGWIKGEDIVAVTGSEGAALAYGTFQRVGDGLVGTFDWTFVSEEFDAPADGNLTVELVLGYFANLVTGSAWFDDVVLEFVDVDTEDPVVPAGQSFTVSEEAGVGSVVGTVVATDNVEVTGFAITAGNTGGVFAIDDAGVLSVASGLDAAATPSYSLTVQASDAAGNTGSGTVGVTVTPAGAFVVVDSFDRPDGPLGSAETGQPWVVSGGLDFAVASDQARVTSGRGEGVALVDAGSADVTASARLVLPSSPSTLGLSLRAVDAANQLLVSMHRSTGKVALYKVDGGAYGQLALSSATFAPGTTHDFAVTLDGAEITVRVDGAVVLTHTLSAGDQATYGSRTGMGLRLYRSASVDFQSRWDDFTVTTGSSSPTFPLPPI